jgi:protein kinase-like protein/3-keto-disaccharide hydrolase
VSQAFEELEEPDQRVHLSGALLKNRYRVVSLLGKGGVGLTYLAMDERSFGAKVVVKLPHAELVAKERFDELFELEARSLLDLELPHLVRVLDLGEFRSLPFVVVEYASGGSLLQRFAAGEGGLQPAEVVGWLPVVAGALDFLHERGFVHRDIKPENILFDHSGRVLLSDLALAKAIRSWELRTGKLETLCGSPAYMAPEALTLTFAQPAYDQYSLGVVLFQTLCGRLPQEWDAPLVMLENKARLPPRNLATFAPQLPMRATLAVMRALSMDPMGRFASCTELAGEFIEGLGTHRFVPVVPKEAERPPSRSPTAPASARRRPVGRGLVAAVAGTAAILAAFAWIVSRGGAPTGSKSQAASEATAAASAQPPRAERRPEAPAAVAAAEALLVPLAPEKSKAAQPPAAVHKPSAPLAQASVRPGAVRPAERRWEPLLTGDVLPGWQTVGQIGWTFRDNVLRLSPATVLVTQQTHRDMAFTLRARFTDPSSDFGLVTRAKTGGRGVKLEFDHGRGILRIGESAVPLPAELTPGQWHQLSLIVRDTTILAYVDQKKAASARDPAVRAGRLGVYCKSGDVEFRSLFVQALD